MVNAPSGSRQRPDKGQRLTVYQNTLRALKERSALREVLEREILHELLKVNNTAISEYPMLAAQQNTVVELLCGRGSHPGYEFIHTLVADFIVLLTHYGKAVKTGESEKAAELETRLLNQEAVLLKCSQGIVYAMALITDNFEELVLRYFGQQALKEYSELIEKHELNERFWTGFVEQFVARRVGEAHKEILEGEKYDISKERTFLVIRFLFDDILSKLNPTDQVIEKTRIQKGYVISREQPEVQKRAKFVQAMLAKGLSNLSQFKTLTSGDLLNAARVACIDSVSGDFEKLYQERVAEAQALKKDPEAAAGRDPEKVKQDNARFKFLMDQLIGLGAGATIAFGMTGDYLFKALEAFVPDQIKGILPLKKDFSNPVLEKLLFFLLENHTVHLLKERGREEGGKIQVRSGRARRVAENVVDGLPGMSKIRKKQLFGNDVTRENTLLFKPKTAKQMVDTMTMLSLEDELQQALTSLWKKAVFRVDIMVLINLELVARTSTNLTARLAEILSKYGVTRTA